jgi:hypothetical protein
MLLAAAWIILGIAVVGFIGVIHKKEKQIKRCILSLKHFCLLFFENVMNSGNLAL